MDGIQQQTEILQNIWKEMVALNARVDRKIDELRLDLGARIDATNERVDVLTGRVDLLTGRVDQVIVRLDRIELRFDNFLTGEHRREHLDLRERVARLEERAGIPPVFSPSR
jgi:hypothetical protein